MAFAAVIALASGLWLSSKLSGKSSAISDSGLATVTLLPTTRPLPELELIDQDGQPFSLNSTNGQWSLLFMGFTNCSHVCPMTMADLRAVKERLPNPVNVIFVSADPQRDSPQVIRAYVRAFHPAFIGVTGNSAELEKLAKRLGASIFVDTSADNYIVDHSSAVFLLNPAGALAGTITPPLMPDLIAAELERIM